MNEFFNLKNLSEDAVIELIKNISNQFEFMDKNPLSEKSEFRNLFLKNEIKDSVTFFGGSFNPIHQGHTECLRLCPEKNIVIVLDRNPHKEFREFNLLKELQTIVSEFQLTPYSIYPGFWTSTKSNPTSEWITRVNVPEVNLLMGDDSFFNFFTWKNPDVILKKIKKLYVVLRNYNQSELTDKLKSCKKINPNLEIIFLEGNKFKDLSSSSLRNKKL